jgi:phage-related tail fiber protein
MPKINNIHAGTGVLGEIKAFSGSTIPNNFLLCDGRAVSRDTYSALFALIGITHGSGNGSTTFNIPDYRGRFLRGVDGTAGNDPNKASRTAMNTGGNTGNNVGSVQADSSNTLVQVDSSKFGGTGAYNGGTISIPSDGSWSGYVESGRDNGQRQNMAFRNSGSETKPKNAYVNYIIRVL